MRPHWVNPEPDVAEDHDRPRIVLFRPNIIDTDSRAKKLGLTLARLGFEVFVISAEPEGADTERRRLGPVTVVPVPLSRTHRDLHVHKVTARRRTRLTIVDRTPKDEYVTRVHELRSRARAARRTFVQLRDDGPSRSRHPMTWLCRCVRELSRFGLFRVLLALRRLRWRLQWLIDVSLRTGWRRWDAWRMRLTVLATRRGMMPELEDYADSFARVLDELEPDVVYAHHPAVLAVALRAARRRRAGGHACAVVYDAREDFLGLPQQERGHVRRHAVLVREEARAIREVDAVVTVSEPIADTLQARYGLPVRPTVILNMPVDHGPLRPGRPTVRQAAGLDAGVPLLVYSGAVSRARGLDLTVDALAHLPGVHLAVVPVPFPHPHQGELCRRAAELGVADRLHFCRPVDQDDLPGYLSGADVGVMPLRTGSPNIAQALPNKLFENLHAGLTMVTSDARLMADFVRSHDLGEVFSDGDPAAYADAVRRALTRRADRDPQRWEKLRRQYSWQAQEKLIRDFFAALVPVPEPLGIEDPELPSLRVTAPAERVAVPIARPRSAQPNGHQRDEAWPLDLEEPVSPDNPADAVEPVRAQLRLAPDSAPAEGRSS